MKNYEVLETLQACRIADNYADDLPGKANYGIGKNVAWLERFEHDLKAGLKPTKTDKEFDEKHAALARKFGKRNDKGDLVTSRDGGVSIDSVEYDEALAALKKEYAESVKEREDRQQQYQDDLEKEADLDVTDSKPNGFFKFDAKYLRSKKHADGTRTRNLPGSIIAKLLVMTTGEIDDEPADEPKPTEKKKS